MKKLFSGKRLIILLALVITAGVAVAVRSCAAREKPDLTLTYIGENYFSSDRFYDARRLIEDNIDDVNGDGKRVAEIAVISFGTNITGAQEQNNLTRLTMSMGGGESRIYIMDKGYAVRYADSEVLADVADFASGDALTNADGKVYAVSVEGNPVLERLGLSDSEDVYIALRAVTEMDGVNFKNIDAIDAAARKAYEYIIKNNINN